MRRSLAPNFMVNKADELTTLKPELFSQLFQQTGKMLQATINNAIFVGEEGPLGSPAVS